MMEQDHKVAVEAPGAPAYVPYTIGGNKGIKEEERDREAKVEAEALVDVKKDFRPPPTDDFWASLKEEEEESPRSPSPARSHSSPRSPPSRHNDPDDKSAIPLHVKEEMFATFENGNGNSNSNGHGNGYSKSRPSLSRNGSTSGTSSPRKVAFAGTSTAASGRGRKEGDVVPIQRPLIDDLPTAWDAAHETYDVLEACVYETKRMGLSREQDEMMVCDCTFDRRNPDAHQCGTNSDCVNRAIFIECLPDECRAKHQCRNQRFAKREFANVEIVQTEKKGFGLRAAEDLPNGTLIYEYIGEVVAEQSFRKRMLQYGQEGIKHFYFMMLQKEEYIDATKKGGIGRFANHSCNPNCEVQKWVVGRRLRMGIFSKRAIQRGEEITFNYNVDRYGHDAQICYCGEPNCVGTIGGKTQTDIAGLDDLFIDALGIGAQVEAEGMKGSKKKKSRQLGEDFIPDLKPITNTEEASKVAAAIRQSADKIRMMGFLLQRVQMTHDKLVHRQFVRAHGFSLMTRILSEMADERQIVLLALQSMAHWQLQYKNKVLDSNVEGPVEGLAKGADAELAAAANELINYWSTLSTEDKITRVNSSSLDAQDDAQTRTIAEAQPYTYSQTRGPAEWENTERTEFKIAPIRPRVPVPSFVRPPPAPIPTPVKSAPTRNDTARVQDYIASIAAAAAAKPAHLASATPSSQSPAESSLSRSPLDEDERRKRAKLHHGSSSVSLSANVNANGPSAYELALQEEEEARKHKQLTRLVGDHVTECMKKYRDVMDRETWKRYAKECTEILVEKEKRGSTYSTSRHPSLSDDKKAKMKAFTKEFTHKVMKRLKDKGKLRKVRSSKSKLSTTHSIGDHASTAIGSAGNEANGHSYAHRDVDVDMDSKETEEANAEYEADLDDMFGKADSATMGNEGDSHVDANGSGDASNGGQGDQSESTSTATGRADSTARRPSLGGSTSPGKMVVVDAWQPGVSSAT